MSRYALVCLLLAGCQTQHHEWSLGDPGQVLAVGL